MKAAIRIVVFDDNVKVLESIEALVASFDDILIVGKFSNCNFIEQRIRETQPDVVLMDIDMPGISGIEATRLIKQNFPAIQILMQTVFDDDQKVFESLCAGASGYIVKAGIPKKLAHSIRDVHAGGSPMSPSIARKVIGMFRNFAPKDLPGQNNYQLTKKEMEVLTLLVEGLSYKLIADRMSVSFGTVHTHLKSIYRKLHVASMSEAVAKAIRERIV